jgi:hypothetical protein
MPNAGAHLLPEAGATREAIRCSAPFGVAQVSDRNPSQKLHYPASLVRQTDLF